VGRPVTHQQQQQQQQGKMQGQLWMVVQAVLIHFQQALQQLVMLYLPQSHLHLRCTAAVMALLPVQRHAAQHWGRTLTFSAASLLLLVVVVTALAAAAAAVVVVV
jgi:hypothetical protein